MARVVILDLGLPAQLLALPLTCRITISDEKRKNLEGLSERFRRLLVNVIKPYVGVSKPLYLAVTLNKLGGELDYLQTVKEELKGVVREAGATLGEDVELLPVLQFNSGIHTAPPEASAYDSEGRSVGSLCPVRGRDWLARALSMLSEAAGGGAAVDLTDFFYFNSETGSTSCLCAMCRRALERKADEVVGSRLSWLEISGRRAVELVWRRGCLARLVKERDEDGYSIYSVAAAETADDLERLMERKWLGSGKSSEERECAEAALAFVLARSLLVAEAVAHAMKGVRGYRAVFTEGYPSEAALSVVTPVFAEAVRGAEVDVYAAAPGYDGTLTGLGTYNLVRGRYLVNQFIEALWMALASREQTEYHELARRRLQRLEEAIARSWTPSPAELSSLSGRYAVFGVEGHVKLLRLIVDTLEYIVQCRDEGGREDVEEVHSNLEYQSQSMGPRPREGGTGIM